MGYPHKYHFRVLQNPANPVLLTGRVKVTSAIDSNKYFYFKNFRINPAGVNPGNPAILYDASDSNSIVINNGVVTEWNPSSGGGGSNFYFKKTASYNAPTRVLNSHNGKYYLNFSPVNLLFMANKPTGNLTDYSLDGGQSIFIVVTRDNVNSGNTNVFGYGANPHTQMRFSSASTQMYPPITSLNPPQDYDIDFETNVIIFEISDNGNGIVDFVTSWGIDGDYIQKVTATKNSMELSQIGGWSAGQYPFDGRIYEIRIYDRVLSENERIYLRHFLGSRYDRV